MFLDWKDVEKQHVIDLLSFLKDIFSDKNKWIDWPLATDDKNFDVDPTSNEASKFNLMGACAKFTAEKYKKPLCDFIDCATRDYMNELSDDKIFKGMMSYDDEYALICLCLEELLKESINNDVNNT